ncbi:MAG: AraC family transcriptional regulator, partial [Dysgonamonadaceae bacterium]|nr:AraC family transcriptional regulator [Dysgonamonadaceae bacterium]
YFTSRDCKPTEIHAGHFFLLFPGEWHNYEPLKEFGWDEYWIGFDGINMNNRIQNGFFIKNKPIFKVGINDEIVHLYKQAIHIAQEQEPGFQQMLAGIVNYLLGLAYSRDKLNALEDLHAANQINQAKIIMRDSYTKNVKLESIANQLNMSYSWFRRAFKQYTGFSPSQYVQELRLQKSKDLLTHTTKSIKEIAYDSGFENCDYFSTAFRKKIGSTPKMYRDFTQGKNL